jgi:vacuolar-type H+-ATPase subunit E/Vma4
MKSILSMILDKDIQMDLVTADELLEILEKLEYISNQPSPAQAQSIAKLMSEYTEIVHVLVLQHLLNRLKNILNDERARHFDWILNSSVPSGSA